MPSRSDNVIALNSVLPAKAMHAVGVSQNPLPVLFSLVRFEYCVVRRTD